MTEPVNDFAGKVAVITGSSRGIGRAVALSLARCGASVVVNYRRRAEAAQSARDELVAAGGKAVAVRADVEHPAEIAQLFDAAREAFGRLDFFVSNAAASSFKPILQLSQHHLDRSFATNVRSFVLGAQHAVSLMDRGGRIVALSSYGSTRVFPTYANLGSAKAAIEVWARYMAVELAPKGINVNAVSGGLIETDSLDHFYNMDGMAPMESVVAKIPKARPGTAQEIADVVVFLLGPGSEYITGQTIVADGGLSLVAPPFVTDLPGPAPDREKGGRDG
ncbi:MAG: SDR family oxidoreductase [Acidimicrobiales bacterium]